MASWDDGDMLATKSVCAEAVFGRRALLSEIPKMKHISGVGFRDLSVAADQALKDIDDMRQILEEIAQQPESLLRSHKADIVSLLRLYFVVVESKSSVLHHWIDDMQHILPQGQHFPLLSWYYSLPPAGLRVIYDGALAPTEQTELKLHIYQILAYLRFQEAYLPLPDAPQALPSIPQELSKAWFPLTEQIPLRRQFNSGMRIYKPFRRGKGSLGNPLMNTTY
ncbi:hypothetical protein H0H87_012816, partial [Tephrocybe sp. NHM501043]